VEGGCGNSSSSESGSLEISINLSNLNCPVLPPSTTTVMLVSLSGGDRFVEPVGPTILLPSTAKVVDFFGQNYDDDLFNHIVGETNEYAAQKRSSSRRSSPQVVAAVHDRQHYPIAFLDKEQCAVCSYRHLGRKQTK